MSINLSCGIRFGHALIKSSKIPLLSFQPIRCKIYSDFEFEFPILLKKGETLPTDDPRNYRPVQPCPKYLHSGSNYDFFYQKFIGQLADRGDIERARDIMRRTCRDIKIMQLNKHKRAQSDDERALIELNPIKILHRAVENCTPVLILQPVVRGGIIYQVPAPPRSESDARHRAMRFIYEAAYDKDKKVRIWTTLSREIVSAAYNDGKAVRKVQELYKQCQENRAYANYRVT